MMLGLQNESIFLANLYTVTDRNPGLSFMRNLRGLGLQKVYAL